MKRIVSVTLICFGSNCFVPLAAVSAGPVLTGELMLWCAEVGRIACGPYIFGVAEAPTSKLKFCTLDASRIQILDAVVGQMKIQPPSDSAPAAQSVTFALERAFPCHK